MHPESIKIALLTANGVNESDMVNIARNLNTLKLKFTTIAPETSLLMTWSGSGWGISYPVDSRLETSLGSDFDAVIVADGARATARLASNPHAKRFLNAFFQANRPVLALGTACGLLADLGLAGDNLLAISENSLEAVTEGLKFITKVQSEPFADKVAA